jgi:hypothetical protein
MEQTAIKADVATPKLEAIRQQAKAIQKLYGGRCNFEEWQWGGDECFKVVLTWKWPKKE